MSGEGEGHITQVSFTRSQEASENGVAQGVVRGRAVTGTPVADQRACLSSSFRRRSFKCSLGGKYKYTVNKY